MCNSWNNWRICRGDRSSRFSGDWVAFSRAIFSANWRSSAESKGWFFRSSMAIPHDFRTASFPSWAHLVLKRAFSHEGHDPVTDYFEILKKQGRNFLKVGEYLRNRMIALASDTFPVPFQGR